MPPLETSVSDETVSRRPSATLLIERVEVLVVSLPQRRPHPTATRARRLGEYVIVKVFAGGLVGLGEATVLKEWGGDFGRYYGEHPATTAKLITEVFAPALLGKDAMQFERLLDEMNLAAKGYPYAKASLDIAVHDVVGKALGVPVYQLLGGRYRQEVPIAHSLGILSTDALLEEVAIAVSEGVRTIKLKVGLDSDRDVEVVRRVRELVGDGITISVDANRAWGTPKNAIRTIRRMEPYGLAFAEQPVEGLHDMAVVTRSVDTDIMADETAWSPEDVLDIARADAANLISIYTTKPGGLHRALKVAAVADAAGFLYNVNGSHETGVGNAANLHLACALRNCKLACVLPVSAPEDHRQTAIAGRSYLDDIITEPFEYRSGSLFVSDRPGLGVELDEEKVRKYLQGSVAVVA